MQIEILGCESFGARSLACVIKTDERKILIDPGVALARLRFGLLLHPVEVAAALRIREKVLFALQGATDVVISHYHGDHMPMRGRSLPATDGSSTFYGRSKFLVQRP